MADRSLEEHLRARLAEWEAGGLTRSLRPPSGVDLSSNDYLNLSEHPFIVERFMAGVAREGCGSTGSRLLRGEREAFRRVERQFAAFKGTGRALYFGSGYLANLGVLSALPEEGDVIFSDALNHASIVDGIRLSRARKVVFPHNDVDALGRLLEQAPPGAIPFVVVESLFSMDGDEAPLAAYASLCRSHRAALIVDEAHAVGIYGERGSGLVEAAGVDADVTVSINTAGKALGVAGAFVAADATTIEYLVQRARSFVYSTAPPPALTDALEASLTIVSTEPERRQQLLSRAAHLRSRLASAGIPVSPGRSQILSVVIGETARAVAVAAELQRRGFDVRPIRPPTVPAGTSRLRVSVNAGLSEATLDHFADSLAVAFQEMGLWSAASF